MRVTMRGRVVAGALLLVGCSATSLPGDEAPGLPIAWMSYADDGTHSL